MNGLDKIKAKIKSLGTEQLIKVFKQLQESKEQGSILPFSVAFDELEVRLTEEKFEALFN